VILTSTNFSHSVLFPILEVIDIKFLNHTVLEYVALSFVKELSMSGTTYLDVNFSSISTFKRSINVVVDHARIRSNVPKNNGSDRKSDSQ